MTPEQQTLLMIKGVIADLPAADQQAVHRVAAQIQSVVRQASQAGVLALALVAATYDAAA